MAVLGPLPDTSTKVSKGTIVVVNLRNYIKEWSQTPIGKNILDAVTNFHIECDELLIQNTSPSELPFCLLFKAFSNETKNVLDKGAIEQAEQSDGEYISNIFTNFLKNLKII